MSKTIYGGSPARWVLGLAMGVAVATLFIGCGDDPTGSGSGVASVEITPSGQTLEVGDTVRLRAILRSAAGDVLDPMQSTIIWSTSDENVLEVALDMVTGEFTNVHAVGEGTATVIVYAGEAEGSAAFTVELIVGDVVGWVSDPFDGALDGATVVLRESGTDLAQGSTGTDGSFGFSNVPAGTYEILASRDGFNDTTAAFSVAAEETSEVQVRLSPESQTSTAVLDTRIVENDGSSLTFEVDLIVTADTNEPVTTLSEDRFSIGDFTGSSGTTYTFDRLGVVNRTGAQPGPYSAMMLLDQSGSITSTDPNDSRIQASKIFMSALGSGDEVGLSAFASSGQLPHEPVTVYGSFTNDGSAFFPTLDDLGVSEGGGTPLYQSTVAMIDYTDAEATNGNRVVIVFTDGQDTDGGATLQDIADRAAATGVKVFTVGLGTGVDLAVLAAIASRTGGTLMWAEDARQLVSFYGTLGGVLDGSAEFYRTSWRVTRSQGSFTSGSGFITSVDIVFGAGLLHTPFLLEVP